MNLRLPLTHGARITRLHFVAFVGQFYTRSLTTVSSVRLDEFPPLTEAQQVVLEKLTTLIGADGINHLASKGVDAFLARLNGYMQFESTLVRQVQDQIALSRLTPVPNAEPKARPLYVNVTPFQGKEGENLLLWVREK